MKKLTGCVILLNILFSIPGLSFHNSLRFRHYTVDDGLSANSTRGLIQDQKGYIWFGTEKGLNKFDGISIKDYSTGYPGGPGNASIITIFEENDGTIWLATDTGIFCYMPDKDLFIKPDFGEYNNADGLSIVYSLCQDKDLNIWFSTYGQGVFRYNKHTNELARYEITDCANNIYYVFADSGNNIWATGDSASGTSLFKFNRSANEFTPFKLTYAAGGRYSNSLAIFEDSQHNLWLGTRESGLQKIDRYTGFVTAYLSPQDGNGIMHIHSIAEIGYMSMLIGSDDGLVWFNTMTGEHKRFTPDEIDPHSLSDQFVYPIVKDREGGIWIGTYYGGINYISPRNGQFEGFSTTKYSNSVSGNIISCFCEDKDGNIWIGSDDGGMSKYSPKTGKFTHYMTDEGPNSLSYHNIHALCLDGDDLWIGTYTGGLNILDTKTGRFRYYYSSDDENSLDQNSVYSIFRDRDGNMWVTTMLGVHLYNRKKDNFIRVRKLGQLTIDIQQDYNGDMWFATQGKGIFRFNTSTQKWTNYLRSEDPGSLPGNVVNCLHIDREGGMWVGTSEGMCKYDPARDAFERTELSAPSQNICCIIEENGKFWITTAKGLVHYIPGEHSLLFTQRDGLQSEFFLPASGLKSSDGKIYFGSIKGFNSFYPHRIRPNQFVPPVVLTGLEISNKEIDVSGNGVLPLPLDRSRQIKLRHRDNVFSIRYAALSYCIPESNRYAYKLDGFDRGWNHVGNQNKATYTNLPAGTYTFKVKASNNDGIWNEEGTELKIVISPPLYFSALFKTLYAILIILSVIFISRFLSKRTKRKHQAEMEELARQKETEMHEAKISFFTTIAHEIRTPVSLIIGPLEKIMAAETDNMPDAIRKDLNVIDRNSQRLLTLVNQLLDFQKVEKEGIRMKFEKFNIYELVKTISDRFVPWVTQRDTRFVVELPDDPGAEVVADKEALTKLISNLLTNASKYTKDEVTLSCVYLRDKGQFTITVSDNGCGISEHDKRKIFEAFYQVPDNKPGTGIGLSLVKNIVNAHSGTIEVRSEVGQGSSFIVTLPSEQKVTECPVPEDTAEYEQLPDDILPKSGPEESFAGKPAMLIIDDNIEMLEFLADNFADEYAVITTENAEDALEIVRKQDISLIISDWMLPRMSGVELCRVIRANQATSHIPLVLLTARTDIDSKIEGMGCGADVYIEKPFSLQYLKSCIKNLIDLREMLYMKFSKMPLMPLNSIVGNQADEEFLSRMNEIIEENFSDPDISIDFLAEKLCISRSGLFSKIKTLTNATPNELIQVVRLKKAAQLLVENKYRINEISYMVGFNNPSYFSKCFQKQFGIKPGEFQKKNRTGTADPD